MLSFISLSSQLEHRPHILFIVRCLLCRLIISLLQENIMKVHRKYYDGNPHYHVCNGDYSIYEMQNFSHDLRKWDPFLWTPIHSLFDTLPNFVFADMDPLLVEMDLFGRYRPLWNQQF